jgi:methionine--tRNA ligase beta chain
MINYEEFKKIELKAAKVLEAERIEGSEKLLKMKLSIGTEERQLVAGIAKAYAPEEMVGKTIIIVANLEPRKLMGFESQGMILAAHGEDGAPVILLPEKEVSPGSDIS